MNPDPASDPGPVPPGGGAGGEPTVDRQHLELELWQSHQRFQAILSTTSDGYWRAGLDGRIIEVNDAYCRMSGYSRDELLGMTVQQIDALDSPERVLERSEQLRREGTIHFQSKHRAKGGELLDLEISLTLVPSTGEAVAFFRDITQRRKAEAALSRSEERLRALLEHSWDILSILDGEGRLVYNSPACERIHGFTVEELLGRSTVDLIHPEDAPTVAAAMGWLLGGPGKSATVEYRYACKDGSWVWMEAVGVNHLDNPAIRGIVVNSREITERRRAQEALKASEALYRELLERQGEGFCMVDAEERFILTNPVAETIFGVPAGGLTGRSLMDFLDDATRAKVQAETVERKAGKASTYELEIRRPDGEKRVILVTATPGFAQGDKGLQVIGVFRDITEAKRAERDLQEKEERFSLVFQSSYDAIFLTDLETGQYVEVNQSFERITGYSPAQALDRNSRELGLWMDPEDRRNYYAELQATGCVRNRLIRIRHRDGHEISAECNSEVMDLGGRTCMVSMARDVSERVRSEASLRDALEFNDRLVTTQPLGVLAYHADSGRCVRANEAMALTVGASVQQLLTQNFRDLVAWKESGMLAAAEKALATDTEQHLEARVQTFLKKECWLSVIFSIFRAGGERHLLVLCEDISDRKRNEMALRKASAAVDQSPAAILITDTQGTIEYVNAAFCRITGYTCEEAVGQNPRILKSGKHDPAFYQGLWNTILAGRTWMGRMCNRRKDGGLYWEEATISPLRNEAGEITHFVASKLDVTKVLEAAEAHRRLEAQVARSQKLESLGSLAGGVAHDMNNVLGAIMAIGSVHQMREPEGSALRRDMDTIVKACQRGGTLVKGLLGFARQELAEERELDLNSLVRDQVDLLARTTLQRVRLDMDLAPELPPIRGDAAALSHVLMNLCLNAVDAMEGGGTLTLSTSSPAPDRVRLLVSDTGCGMTKAVLEKALDPFFTTKPQGKGTGLGLPIVYGAVKAHRGQMDIESIPGQGTRVSIHLPAAVTQAALSPVPEASAHLGTRSLDVLLVDDDELVQASVSQVLSALGHHAVLATTGEEALGQLAAGLRVDVVILDLNMPGLGGARTLPQLRALRPDLPVMLATGRVDQEALSLIQQFPGVSLFPKPFTMKDLRERLVQLGGD